MSMIWEKESLPIRRKTMVEINHESLKQVLKQKKAEDVCCDGMIYWRYWIKKHSWDIKPARRCHIAEIMNIILGEEEEVLKKVRLKNRRM